MEYTLNATKLFWSRSGIMHVAIAWDHKPLLLLATALLPNRTTESFESEAGPPYDKQRIQMGLRSGNTVLICFRSGVGHFQSVLIALTADLFFFSCIAERVRDIVGQQLEIRKREQLLGTNMQKVIAKGLCLLETKR